MEFPSKTPNGENEETERARPGEWKYDVRRLAEASDCQNEYRVFWIENEHRRQLDGQWDEKPILPVRAELEEAIGLKFPSGHPTIRRPSGERSMMVEEMIRSTFAPCDLASRSALNAQGKVALGPFTFRA
ncbi:MAG: hypothetical protein ACYDFT_00840 [Thermoplasmata archaeon]